MTFVCKFGAALGICGVLVSMAVPAMAADKLTKAGDVLQYALPLAAGVCAVQQGQTGTFAAGYATAMLATEGLKYGLANASVNKRPDGTKHGMPSGHTASAFFGATSLARKCAPDQPVVGIVAFGLAAAVGVSRVQAHKHTAGQVVAGALIGYFANGVSVDFSDGGTSLGYSWSF